MRQLVPSLILGAIVVIGLMLLAGLNDVSQHFIDYHWEFFGMALGLAFFGNTIRFFKRAIAFRISGIKGLSFSIPFNYSSPACPWMLRLPAWVIPIRLWLFRLAGIPHPAPTSVYLLEQLSDNLSIFFLTVFGVTCLPFFLAIIPAHFASLLHSHNFPAYET